MNNRYAKRFAATLSLAALAVVFLPGCFVLHRHRNKDLAGPVNPGDQPDKILFEKATNEITHGRYDVGRLTLQTMMNTYPDSEYLAKAKLAIADSYYKEGGVSGLTEAELEYKDFITFFPTAPEAPEAQYRVGMAHFRLMGKPDRDRQEALLAEAEFKEFLLKYPDSRVMPVVKARLREVQEVLGESDFKIAQFYYARGAWPAAKGRFQEIAESYPDFSRTDDALWYLAQSYEHMKQSGKAVVAYDRILTEYPLSDRVDDAKDRLTAMHQPVPQPTKAVLARAEADKALRRPHRDLLAKFGGVMSSAPDVSATRHGPVVLGPKPAPIEAAATTPTQPTPGGASISVQPVGDAALNSGKAVDTKPTGADTTQSAPNSPSSTGSAPSNPSPDPDPPVKKKKKKSFLKKLLPF
ncbi:MAG TPA: outer membrane protein assembly factor BamD [Terriglobia bacterium]|nr:outer membrane protein assembly factor BamD [Terriglobia bacterium]